MGTAAGPSLHETVRTVYGFREEMGRGVHRSTAGVDARLPPGRQRCE